MSPRRNQYDDNMKKENDSNDQMSEKIYTRWFTKYDHLHFVFNNEFIQILIFGTYYIF